MCSHALVTRDSHALVTRDSLLQDERQEQYGDDLRRNLVEAEVGRRGCEHQPTEAAAGRIWELETGGPYCDGGPPHSLGAHVRATRVNALTILHVPACG